MNEKKICFIICVNNEKYLEESISYINRLNIPDGFEIDLLTIDDCDSMAAGYQEAMDASDAKYKIYMHQDTYINNVNILYNITDIFGKDKSIGAIGMRGSAEFISNNITSPGDVYGKVLTQTSRDMLMLEKYRDKHKKNGPITGEYVEVGNLFGFFYATQYDCKWEDLFDDDWKYTTEIHSLIMRENGYKLVVPKQDKPWVSHNGNCDGNCHSKYVVDKFIKRFEKLIENRMNNRILFMNTKEVSIPMLAYDFYRTGYYVETYYENIECLKYDEGTACRLAEWLENNDYLFIVGYEFSQSIAEAAHRANVKYLSWAWDSPLLTHYKKESLYDTSIIYSFDKEETKNLIRYGAKNVYHLPLTTNVFATSGLVISDEDERTYSHDVSFVGNMYDEDLLGNLDRYFPKEKIELVKNYIYEKSCNWENNVKYVEDLKNDLSESYFKHINKYDNDDYMKAYFEYKMARNIAHVERVKIFNKIAEKFDFHLYTKKGSTDELRGVRIHGPVGFYDEAPKIYHLSKINLNITLHSIKTGVPLRIFDIMGVGGFVLSNYQEEIVELFKEDKEIVLFRNIDELIDKIDYYLKHDQKRVEIAMNGYKKVRDHYSHEHAIKKMLDMAGIERY